MRTSCYFAVLASLVLAGQAQAAVVYERTASHAIVAARNDGSQPRVIAHGYFPVIAPDGGQVLFVKPGREPYDDLYVVEIDGSGEHRVLRHALPNLRTPRKAWSSNSRYIVAGDEMSGATQVVDLETGERDTIGTETYGDASFGPGSRRLVITDVVDPHGPPELLVRHVDGSEPHHVAFGESPLWGPPGLAFTGSSAVKLKRRLDQPGEVVLPRTQQEHWAWPVDWSLHGTWLLVARGHSERELHAYFVRPSDRRVVRVPRVFAELDAMSRDAKAVLGMMSGNVVSVTRSGAVHVLAYAARSPSWTK